jgi:hypothetical protein
MGMLSGCGSSTPSTSKIEHDLRPALERQLQQRAGSAGRVTVHAVSCVRQSDSHASCLANVSASDGSRAKVAVTVDIDPDTGKTLWQVQQ